VPDDRRDGQQPDAPARRAGDQLGSDRGVEDCPEDADCLRTVLGAALAVHALTRAWTSAGVIEASGRLPRAGMR
jgi:hypothetical protein